MSKRADLEQAFQALARDGRAVIDGQRRETPTIFEDISPATGTSIATVSQCSASDVDDAVASSRRAYDSAWSTMSSADRKARLHKLADLITANAQELALLDAMDMGLSLIHISEPTRPY